MAKKSANVTARVQPEIKQQAEAVLERIGLPVSVLIDTLYRQIIMTGGVPYSLAVPKLPTRDSLTDEQFNTMMEKGYDQAKSGEGLSVDEAFAKIREGIWLTEDEPWHTKGIRKMPVKNFLVYYLVDEEKKVVWITAVIYGRRDQIVALLNMSLNGTVWTTIRYMKTANT